MSERVAIVVGAGGELGRATAGPWPAPGTRWSGSTATSRG